MRIHKLKLKLTLLALLPIMLLIKELLYSKPDFTEAVYSRVIFPPLVKILNILTGWLPLSLAELLVLAVIPLAVYNVIRFIYHLYKSHDKLQTTINWILNILCAVSIIYCLFLLLWGFNYYRQPLAYSLGYKIEKSTVADLKELCSQLIDKTNQLRAGVTENEAGIAYIKGGFNNAASRADVGYQNLSSTYPFFKGSFGRPKSVIFSRQLCYAGIGGIYFPFTGEANVNKLVPDSMLPSTICHEMAHQRGFAREDEANFIAYLVCKNHEDIDFQYSGYLLATIYSMNALAEYDLESYRELSSKYSEGVKRDLKYYSDFWKQFEGPVEELQEKVNDSYLKHNKQSDGIYSYGRMVDLLLAEYKKGR